MSSLAATNCSLSSNRCVSSSGGYGSGGGIYSTSALAIVSCTIASNSAYQSGGVYSYDRSASSLIRNSLIAGNRSLSGYFHDFDSTAGFTSQGHNFIGSAHGFSTAPSDIVSGADPRLGPFSNNGGPTLTHALLSGSPALEAGDDSLTGTDQRGFPRLSGAHVDIGAFEFTLPSPQNPGLRRLTNGASQFTFTTFSDVSFSVLASTNVALPSNQWVNLGPAILVSNSLYQFSDTDTASNRHRFFRLRWP